MPEIARRTPSSLKPLNSELSPEVRRWVQELRQVWGTTGLSMNQFVDRHRTINKGTISRYLSGERVPRESWFLDTLLDFLADAGKPVTQDVREHLTQLQKDALATAHPHEYKVRKVTDELELAVTDLQEAQSYARSLEKRLVEKNRQIHELTDARGRLRAERDRLEQQAADLSQDLVQARRDSAQAGERRRQLEKELNHLLEASRPAPGTDTSRKGLGSSKTHHGLFIAPMLLALLAVSSASADIAAPAAVPPPPAGFSLTWSNDFNGARGTGLDTGTWRYDTGSDGFGTGEIESATDSTANVFQDGNGHLVLNALHSGSNPRAGWTSGRVETRAADFGARPGGVVMIQASIQQPDVRTANGVGYWPAFWMLGAAARTGTLWPASGAIDILEDVNGRSSVFGHLHCGTNPNGPCREPAGLSSGEHACTGCQTAFHTYAVQIDRSVWPEQIRWYLDDTNYFTVRASQMDATTWAKAVDHPFSIFFDLAIGGGFPNAFGPGPNNATVSGGQLNIDYIAVYNKAP